MQNFFFINTFKKIYVYIYRLHWVFCATWDLHWVMWDLSLKQVDSLVVTQSSRVHELSCPVACGILVPQLRLEPLSPALQGRFLTTGPPGKSPKAKILYKILTSQMQQYILLMINYDHMGFNPWNNNFI